MNGHPDQDTPLGKALGIAVGVLLFGLVVLYVLALSGAGRDCGREAFEAYKARPGDTHAASDYVVTRCR